MRSGIGRVGYRFSASETALVDAMKRIAPKYLPPLSNEARLLFESLCAKADGRVLRRASRGAVGGWEYCWNSGMEE